MLSVAGARCREERSDRAEASEIRGGGEAMSTEIPMVTYWRGVDIRKMSREDLEKAFSDLGRLYQHTQDSLMEAHMRAIPMRPGKPISLDSKRYADMVKGWE
jgi:hypothetical protein